MFIKYKVASTVYISGIRVFLYCKRLRKSHACDSR